MSRKNSKQFLAARKMPELRHSIPGQPFDIRESEVVRWLVQQPEIMQYVFDKLNYSGDIVYDRERGTWKGADR